MPDIEIIATPGNLGPSPCYTSEQQRYNAFTAATQYSLPINFTTVIVSTTAPGPDDRDKVWIRVDGAGRILGTFLFSNGQWQTIFPSSPIVNPGEIREYDPALYTPAQSADSPWFPMDGSVVGVRDRRGLWLVGAGTRVLTAAQITAGVQASTFVAGTVLGSENVMLKATNIPAHTHTLHSRGPIGLAGAGSGTSYVPNTAVSGVADNEGFVAGGNTTGNDSSNVPNPPAAFNTFPPSEPTYWMQWRPDLV